MLNKKSISNQSVVFPSNVGHSLDTACRNWEEFICTGRFRDLNPRSVICESWVRSRERGLDPQSTRAPTVMSPERLEEKLRQGDLGKAAIKVMEKIALSVEGNRHVVVLADHKGRILHSVGHEDIQSELEKINFRPGGLWTEDEVGPNGIGTTLMLGRPEVVMGHEHYCKGWQPWVCYGAPIADVCGGGVAGVIDITGPIDQIRRETMTLAISLAQSVHSGLTLLQLNRREILRSVCRDRMLRWPNDGVMLVDENGYLIDYNSRASRLMNLEFPECVENPVTRFLPDLWEVILRSIRQNIMEEMRIEMRSETGFSHTVRVRIEPVLYRQENLGALLILSAIDSKNVHTQEQQASRGCSTAPTKYTFDNIRGTSPKLRDVLTLARAASRDPMESSVLLIGDTGTGKELLAHSIHAESTRSDQPFIAINCGALPRDLIESELFGYVPGAFTGARKDGMKGKFEHAAGGTLFLDEIDSLDLDLQSRFLRVLDHNEINRIGSVESMHVDVRIIAAGSSKMFKQIESGQFRQDLYHRLSVLEIEIPPLAERGEDVIELAGEFLERESWAAGRPLLELSAEAKDILLGYGWPGNIRELHNLCRRWVLMVQGDMVRIEHVPDKLRTRGEEVRPETCTNRDLRTVNDELIRTTLVRTGGNVSKAARILGIDRSTIYRRSKINRN